MLSLVPSIKKQTGMGLIGKCLDFLQLENIPDRISISSFSIHFVLFLLFVS